MGAFVGEGLLSGPCFEAPREAESRAAIVITIRPPIHAHKGIIITNDYYVGRGAEGPATFQWLQTVLGQIV
jgi:hypothetical protein